MFNLNQQIAKSELDLAIKNNEPVFVLRAKDCHAISALTFYIDCIAEDFAIPPERITELAELKSQFLTWMKSNLNELDLQDTAQSVLD